MPTSIDTMRASVAEFALDAGVQLVNDVSGGLADPQLPRLVAAAGVGYVVVHWRGHSHDMYSRAVYADPVSARSATSSAVASMRWWPPGSTRTASWSTRASASGNGRSTTGRC